jgi:hypothetical protein
LKGCASNYQHFGDLLVATHWKHSAAGQEWTAVYKTVDFDPVDPAVFEPPAEIAAQLEKPAGE